MKNTETLAGTPGDPLRQDGPTLDEYIAAGYKAENYPAGYAARSNKKYFHALNSNRFVLAGKLQFSFSPYCHAGGIWMGTYATDDAEQIAALESLPNYGTPKCAVSALTPEEYDNCQKKKAATLQSLGQSLIHSELSPSNPRSANLAAPLDTEPPATVAAAPIAENVDSLEVGEVKTKAE